MRSTLSQRVERLEQQTPVGAKGTVRLVASGKRAPARGATRREAGHHQLVAVDRWAGCRMNADLGKRLARLEAAVPAELSANRPLSLAACNQLRRTIGEPLMTARSMRAM